MNLIGNLKKAYSSGKEKAKIDSERNFYLNSSSNTDPNCEFDETLLNEFRTRSDIIKRPKEKLLNMAFDFGYYVNLTSKL